MRVSSQAIEMINCRQERAHDLAGGHAGAWDLGRLVVHWVKDDGLATGPGDHIAVLSLYLVDRVDHDLILARGSRCAGSVQAIAQYHLISAHLNVVRDLE